MRNRSTPGDKYRAHERSAEPGGRVGRGIFDAIGGVSAVRVERRLARRSRADGRPRAGGKTRQEGAGARENHPLSTATTVHNRPIHPDKGDEGRSQRRRS